MILDAHTHLFAEEVRLHRRTFCRRDEAFRLLYENEKARLAGPQDLLAAMDRDGVEKSVICGFPWDDPGLCREGNDFLLRCSRDFPDRFLPFATLPPRSARQAARERERCLAEGFSGFGEMAFYRRDLSARAVQTLASLLAPLAAAGVPLLLHANEAVGHDYPGKSPVGLRSLYELLRALAEVKVILAHWGGGFFFYELMPEVARAARNVFYDTAASPFLYDARIYEVAVRIVGERRILFGSDYPLLSPARYFREMAAAGIAPQVQGRIKGLNAASLLPKEAQPSDAQGDHV